MPATSEKQKKFMDAVAHNKGFAKKAGVPQSVGKDFSEASKGMKFGSGNRTRAESQAINQPKTNHGDMALFKKGGSMASKMNPGFMAMMAKKKDAKPSAMGKPTMKAGMSTAKDGMKKPTPMADMMGMKKGGMKKMAAGGSTVPVQKLPYMGPKKEAAPKPIHPAGLGSGTQGGAGEVGRAQAGPGHGVATVGGTLARPRPGRTASADRRRAAGAPGQAARPHWRRSGRWRLCRGPCAQGAAA